MRQWFFIAYLSPGLWLLTPSQAVAESARPPTYVLPVKNELPLSPDTFCQGVERVLAKASENLQNEAAAICQNGQANAAFNSLLQNPFQGQGDPADFIQTLQSNEQVPANHLQIFIGYSMVINNEPVAAHIIEEKFVETPYTSQDQILKISNQFETSPLNLGDSDTVFQLKQTVDVNRQDNPQVKFTDVSTHYLKLYTLHPDNFDFFLAARTLVTPTEQFAKAVVLRGVYRNPNNPAQSIVVSILNFMMNDRGGGNIGDGIEEAFMAFIVSDMGQLYMRQNQAGQDN